MPAINSANRLVAAVTLALSLLASSSDVAAQVRTIQRSEGMPLARRLEPGDAVVNVVQSLDHMVEEPGTTWRDLVDRYLREGCDVVLVRAASAESRLVEEESWIATVFSGVNTQWLSAGQGRDTSANGLGSTLQWSADGGEVVLGGVRVRTDNWQNSGLDMTICSAYAKKTRRPGRSSRDSDSPSFIDACGLRTTTKSFGTGFACEI